MYGWTLIILLFLSIFTSVYRQEFPLGLLVAVLVSCLLDLGIKKLLKKSLAFPYSAFITGLIIGSVAQFSAPLWVIVVASIVAIGSKHLIKIKKQHIFNPATLGLLVAFFIFSSGDEWWASIAYNFFGYSIILTPLLILANYRAGKLAVSIPFLVVIGALFVGSGLIPLSSGAPTIVYSLPFFFGFIMVSEPKTSPYQFKEQLAFGVGLAVLTFVFMFYSVLYYPFLALLIGNFGFAVYRVWKSKQNTSESPIEVDKPQSKIEDPIDFLSSISIKTKKSPVEMKREAEKVFGG